MNAAVAPNVKARRLRSPAMTACRTRPARTATPMRRGQFSSGLRIQSLNRIPMYSFRSTAAQNTGSEKKRKIRNVTT